MPFIIMNKTTTQVLSAQSADRTIRPWIILTREDASARVRELLLKNPENTYQVFEDVGTFEAKVEVVSV